MRDNSAVAHGKARGAALRFAADCASNQTMPVRYELQGAIATIAIDDGKVNALSFEVIAELGAAIDRAAADRAAVVLTGRDGVLSAGFDLRVLRGGPPDALRLVIAGFELLERAFGFPGPLVVACPGHAVAMGAFLTLAGDVRIGVRGAYKLGANEVAIGLVMPHVPTELCRHRLATTHFHRAVATAEMFAPDDAVTAGFLDRVVAPDELASAAHDAARRLAELPRPVFVATKQRARAPTIAALGAALAADRADLRV